MRFKPCIKIGVFESPYEAWGSVETVDVPRRLVKGRSQLLAVYLSKYLKEHLENILREAK